MLARLRITTCINVTLFLAVFGTAEEALRESEARLQFALEAANAGTWEGVPETGEFTASDRALALHGLPPGTLMTQEKAAAAAHPDDRPRLMEALRHYP
jgi:PAS domain-containing protein